MDATAIRIYETGGADVLRREKTALPPPGNGEILIKTRAVGVNYIDIYHRTGLYPVALPATLGLECAGTVEAVGDGVSGVALGARVGCCVGGLGAYADYRLLKADAAIPLPDDVSFEQAAAVLLKGMTAEYLIRRACPVRAGDTILWHAAAGGVGLLACQWLKQLDVEVIGTAGTPEKAELAKAHGCAHVILYGKEDVAARVREITNGAGVPAAFDSVGAATFQSTLKSLAPRGMFVSFGNASGAVPPFAPSLLAENGSLFFTRPTLAAYCAPPDDMRASADALFFAMRAGLRPVIGQTLPLAEAAAAHRALESRQTTGATVLLP
ncbi:MAG: quinone oxidoreductase family protein [Gammaproteobacteria bacterium]